MTPTQRSLAWCRSQNWLADVAEHWQPSFAQPRVVNAAKDLAGRRELWQSLTDLRRAVAQMRIDEPRLHLEPAVTQGAVVEAACRVADDTASLAKLDALLAAIEQLDRSGPGRRQDLFSCLDILAIGGGQVIGIQTTATSGMSARVKKIKTECAGFATAWLGAGARLLVIGWKEYAQPVNRRRWRETVRELTLADFDQPEEPCPKLF